MQSRTVAVLAGLMWAAAMPTAQAAGEIRVISDRTPAHLEPLFEQYEQGAGVTIRSVFVDDGLIARLSARPTEADVIITSTADILEQAKLDDLIRPIPEAAIANVRPEFRDPGGKYVMLSYRARALYVSKDRVKPGEITRYEQLAEPRWKGRVCIRSGYHRYNVSLFAQMAADRGVEWTRAFMTGLRDNLARPPKGNDRNQVRGIFEDVCDVAIANSYYMGIMLGRDDQRAWGEAAAVVFPDQQGRGSYVLTGGMALTAADRAVEEATAFMRFMLSDYGQRFIANTTYEYPVIESVELPAANRALGGTQPEVKGGRFKANVVPLGEIEGQRAVVSAILDEIDFNRQ